MIGEATLGARVHELSRWGGGRTLNKLLAELRKKVVPSLFSTFSSKMKTSSQVSKINIALPWRSMIPSYQFFHPCEWKMRGWFYPRPVDPDALVSKSFFGKGNCASESWLFVLPLIPRLNVRRWPLPLSTNVAPSTMFHKLVAHDKAINHAVISGRFRAAWGNGIASLERFHFSRSREPIFDGKK